MMNHKPYKTRTTEGGCHRGLKEEWFDSMMDDAKKRYGDDGSRRVLKGWYVNKEAEINFYKNKYHFWMGLSLGMIGGSIIAIMVRLIMELIR